MANLGTGEVTGPTVMTLDGLELGDAEYQIKWVSASADDGDIERGQLTFTVQVEAASPSAQAPSTAPSATVSPTENDVPSAEPSERDAVRQRRRADAGAVRRADVPGVIDLRRPAPDRHRPAPRRRRGGLRPAPQPRRVARRRAPPPRAVSAR